MPDDSAIAVWTNWGEGVDCALEAVECVPLAGHDHVERLVILVFANFAFSHTKTLSRADGIAAVSGSSG